MTILAIIGIALEIVGFFLIIKSTKKLNYKPGGFIGPEYVDPKNRQTAATHRELPKSASL
jgi:hypothetical protein